MDGCTKTSGGILNSARKTSFLPLRDAVLCGDCNFVSAAEEGVCPVCHGRSLSRLSDRLLSAGKPAGSNQGEMGYRRILQLLGFRRRNRQNDFAYLQR
ncbi:MAG: hypothetical protein LAO20_00530 [Acidobacteriia bacterium]|nr:hypothetical protein [Terriglobia bacterium]